jgi:subtilase family serine protease
MTKLNAIALVLALGASQLLAGQHKNAANQSGKNSPDFVISGNTPGFIQRATDNGPANPTDQITVTAWLKLHKENQLQELLNQQVSKGNKQYHKWLTQDQFNADYSPTANEANAVQNFLAAHNLTVLYVAENNFYVKVQGSIADVQKAFHVQVHQYNFKGANYRSNTGDPSVTDSNGGLIAAVTGIDDYGFQPTILRAKETDGTISQNIPLSQLPNGFFFEGQCFAMAPETHTFTQPGTTAVYSGNRFGSDITNNTLGHLAPCGYQPSEMYTAYNMNAAFQAGYDGTGETVVITDAFGSAEVATEAAVFSDIYGLPPINFQQLRAPGAIHNTSPHFGGGSPTWHDEIALDVEWSHAMAPGAKIILVVGPNNTNDLDEAINYAVVHHLGNTISNSWSSVEGFGNPAQHNRMNRILMAAAAQGIDVNFSSGDNGDEEANVGFKTVDFPGSSPFATSIGGTSLFLNPDNTIKFQTGWGTNETRIADISPSAGVVLDDNPPVDPPLHIGFVFGSGGGSSLTFAKPSFQAGIPGTTRQVPDIAMLADPFTGGEFISTDLPSGQLVVGVVGGTSLACPMFSGIMADAAQKNGHVGFGQAAPLLYNLPAGAVTDVPGTFAASATNVSGTIMDPAGTTNYSADQLSAPLDGVTNYVSAFYNSPFSTRYFNLTFGTDSSLFTATGWDNVTGVGTPNGLNFITALAP